MSTTQRPRALIAAVALASALAGAVALAQPGPGNGPKGPPSCDRIADHIGQRLALTDTQKPLFMKVCEDRRAQMESTMEQRRTLQSIATAAKFDAAKARSVARDWAQSTSERMVEAARNYHAFYQSLSPQQREQIKQMRERHREHFKQWRQRKDQ